MVRDAIILVAGRGRRLRPLTDDRPKCLIEVGAAPIVVRLLRQLAAAGIERAVLVTGYMQAAVAAAVESAPGLPTLTLAHEPDFASANNAWSLRAGLRALGLGRSFLLCDGDVLLTRSLWLEGLLDDERGNVLAYLPRDEMGAEEMKLAFGTRGATGPITALSKELDPEEAAGESIGIQTVDAASTFELMARLEDLDAERRRRLYYEDVFAQMMGDDHPFYGRAIEAGVWAEIDTVEDLEAARALLAEHRGE